jgi:hypothetical protein
MYVAIAYIYLETQYDYWEVGLEFLSNSDLDHRYPTFYGRWQRCIFWAGLRAARGQIALSGISKYINYFVIFIVSL